MKSPWPLPCMLRSRLQISKARYKIVWRTRALATRFCPTNVLTRTSASQWLSLKAWVRNWAQRKLAPQGSVQIRTLMIKERCCFIMLNLYTKIATLATVQTYRTWRWKDQLCWPWPWLNSASTPSEHKRTDLQWFDGFGCSACHKDKRELHH